MKKIILGWCVCSLAVVAMAQTGQPSFITSEKTEIKATVQNIDYAKREVTLKGPQGKSVKLKVGEEARNFDQIKKGDEVVAAYYQSAALSLAKKGETPVGQAKTESVYRAEKGQKPSGLALNTHRITATVEEVDREKREVTLKGPEGNSVVLKVDESVGDLTRIKKGDEIVATYSEALAISVRKP